MLAPRDDRLARVEHVDDDASFVWLRFFVGLVTAVAAVVVMDALSTRRHPEDQTGEHQRFVMRLGPAGERQLLEIDVAGDPSWR